MEARQRQLYRGRRCAAQRSSRTFEGCTKDTAFEVPLKSVRPRQINMLIISAAEVKDANVESLILVLDNHLPQMNLVNLSTSIHRLAKLAVKESDIQHGLGAHRVVRMLLSMTHKHLAAATVSANLQQTLSNIAWSLATMQILDVALLETIGAFATNAMPGFKPFELSTLLWAFAKLGTANAMPWSAQPLFRAASTQTLSSVGLFSFRSLANIVWAFATAGLQDADLFSGVSKEMCRTVGSANSQGIANTIWAFSTVHHVDKRLFTVLTEASLLMMDDFKAQEISSMLWGMATNGFYSEAVFVRAVAAAQGMDLGPQHIANILWASSRAVPKNPIIETVVIQLLPRCTLMFEAFKIQEISSIFSALLKMFVGEGTLTFAAFRHLHVERSVHPNILEFLRIAVPWAEHNIRNLSDQTFASVVVVLAMSGVTRFSKFEFSLDQWVFERAQALEPEEVLLLLGALLLAPTAAKHAVCLLAANLVHSFRQLRPRELSVLHNISSAVQGTPLDSQPDHESLHYWCLALATNLSWEPPNMMPHPTSVFLEHVCLPYYSTSDEAMKTGVSTCNLFGSVELDNEEDDILSYVGPACYTREHSISTEDSLSRLDGSPSDTDGKFPGVLCVRRIQRGDLHIEGSSGHFDGSRDGETDSTSSLCTEATVSKNEFLISTEESLPFLALEEHVYRNGYAV